MFYALSQSALECRRTVVLLQQISEHLVRDLLEGAGLVFGQLLDGGQ
jgi:hypothetical protein